MTKTPITDALKSILSSEERWTQRANARDAKGERVEPLNTNAISFCLYGACTKASSVLPINKAQAAFIIVNDVIRRTTNWDTMVQMNDSIHTTFKDIQAVLNKAAEIEARENTNANPT